MSALEVYGLVAPLMLAALGWGLVWYSHSVARRTQRNGRGNTVKAAE